MRTARAQGGRQARAKPGAASGSGVPEHAGGRAAARGLRHARRGIHGRRKRADKPRGNYAKNSWVCTIII